MKSYLWNPLNNVTNQWSVSRFFISLWNFAWFFKRKAKAIYQAKKSSIAALGFSNNKIPFNQDTKKLVCWWGIILPKNEITSKNFKKPGYLFEVLKRISLMRLCDYVNENVLEKNYFNNRAIPCEINQWPQMPISNKWFLCPNTEKLKPFLSSPYSIPSCQKSIGTTLKNATFLQNEGERLQNQSL